MGFGFLLIGYVFAFLATVGLGPYVFGGIIVGSVLMFIGLKELKKYDPVFFYAYSCNICLFACGLLLALVWAIESFTTVDISIFSTIVSSLKLAFCLLFDISMLYGIADLSRRVDYPETRQKAYRNMIFVGVFNALQLLVFLPIGFIQNSKGFLMALLLIIQLIYTAVNALLIFKCYVMICPEGQEDMPRKKSKFAFINKFREIRDAKDEKAMEEMKNYYEGKLKNRNAKKMSKKKKK